MCFFGELNFYGIEDIIKSDKEKSLIYFKKSYQLSKKKKSFFLLERIIYIYIDAENIYIKTIKYL